jgi:hypothetical protein
MRLVLSACLLATVRASSFCASSPRCAHFRRPRCKARALRVERYGFNEQGYLTRVMLVGLCAAAVRSTKRARAAFLGCGALWTVAEAILTLTTVREGVTNAGGVRRC